MSERAPQLGHEQHDQRGCGADQDADRADHVGHLDIAGQVGEGQQHAETHDEVIGGVACVCVEKRDEETDREKQGEEDDDEKSEGEKELQIRLLQQNRVH